MRGGLTNLQALAVGAIQATALGFVASLVLSCAGTNATSAPSSQADPLPAGQDLLKHVRDKTYDQQSHGMRDLQAQVFCRARSGNSKAADPILLDFFWKAPHRVKIVPAPSEDSPRASAQADELLGLANLIIKREMPPSHRVKTIYEKDGHIIAERPKGKGIVRVIFRGDGHPLRMHHVVPDSESGGSRNKFTFDISARQVVAQWLWDGLTLYMYPDAGNSGERIKVLQVSASFTDVQTQSGPVKIGTTLDIHKMGGKRVLCRLEDLEVNEGIPDARFEETSPAGA
jgi:hypothetical protein